MVDSKKSLSVSRYRVPSWIPLKLLSCWLNRSGRSKSNGRNRLGLRTRAIARSKVTRFPRIRTLSRPSLTVLLLL